MHKAGGGRAAVTTVRASPVGPSAVGREDGSGIERWAHPVLRVTDAALAHLDVDELLEELLERVAAEIDVEVAAVLLVDERGDQLVRRAARGLETEAKGGGRVPIGAGFAGRVAAERGPVVLYSPRPGDVFCGDLAERGVSALLGVPLVVGGRVTGVLHVGSLRPRQFNEDDIALLELVAHRAALAIEHAALFEREHRIAETLQRSLLPRELPRVSGLEACARYIPGSPGTTIGGDWYDVFPLSCRRVGLVIGDVAGRGTRAATVMGVARHVLRAYALEGHPPARAVELLDRLLQSAEPGEMVTLVYLVVDIDAGTATVTNAGHPPPFLTSGEQGTFIDGGRSLPLGVMADAPRYESVVPLGVDSRIVLYTDGLIERRKVSLDHGLAALREAIASAPHALDELCDHVLRTMVAATGLGDDAAVLAVRTGGCTGEGDAHGRPFAHFG